jgi:hypothetical protein
MGGGVDSTTTHMLYGGLMVILTTDVSRFKSEFPNIYVLNTKVSSPIVQHEMMLNDSFKENLCTALDRRYGIFACDDRSIVTDSILKSHLSCIVDYGNLEEYNIQGYKSYFGRVPVLRDCVFSTYEEFCDYVNNNQVGVRASYTMDEFKKENILKILKDTGGFIMPNIEESIRIAMRELGIDTDDVDTSDDVITNTKDTTADEIAEEQGCVEVELGEEPEEVDEKPSVYVKIKGDTVALIFGSGMRFSTRDLGGANMNVLTFKMPNLNSDKLQELEVIEDTVDQKSPVKKSGNSDIKSVVHRKPIVNSTVPKVNKANKVDKANKANKSAVNSADVEELKNQKVNLDKQIKEARSDGNIELVNSLRKQRRAIRNRINSLGG